MNFTVHVTPGACEMWGGSQVQATAQGAAAKVLGIAQDKVTFHNYMLGGGFGRRLDTDMVEKSVRIAQKVDGPVKVIWIARRRHAPGHVSPGLSQCDVGIRE